MIVVQCLYRLEWVLNTIISCWDSFQTCIIRDSQPAPGKLYLLPGLLSLRLIDTELKWTCLI